MPDNTCRQITQDAHPLIAILCEAWLKDDGRSLHFHRCRHELLADNIKVVRDLKILTHDALNRAANVPASNA